MVVNKVNKVADKYKNVACDKKGDLFMLQHEQLSAEGFDAPPSAGSTIRFDINIINNIFVRT